MNLLITGTSSGIGRAAATYFTQHGHTVCGIDITQSASAEHFAGYVCDITNETALNQLHEEFCQQGMMFDAIINIAGIHMMASLVESNFQQMKKVIDINLTGTMLVNRVFHDRLYVNGRILIVTSEVASFDPMPFNGLYNVSKTALDTYAQALRQELNLIGQKVITIRPGAVETPLSEASMKATQDLANETFLYSKQAKNFVRLATKFMGTPIKPCALAKLIYKAATAKHPRLVYKKHRNSALVLLNVLPKCLQCTIIKLLLNLTTNK